MQQLGRLSPSLRLFPAGSAKIIRNLRIIGMTDRDLLITHHYNMDAGAFGGISDSRIGWRNYTSSPSQITT